MIGRVRKVVLIGILPVLACIGITVGCHSVETKNEPAEVPEIRPGILAGYLQPEAFPNSLALIPPPPSEGSAAKALDEEVSRRSFVSRSTPRWELAIEDANLMFPEAAGTFSCALGVPITEQDTPHLYMVLRRTLADAGLCTYAAKDKYQRARPFIVNEEPTCTPEEEDYLRKDGSYPSGHTALGWAWALILTEVAPERADEILARGRAFGESRVVCNVHWHSDVVAGRFMGAAVVARLHADPAFRAELEAAKAEVPALRGQGLKPNRDCQAEAEALAYQPRPLTGEVEILKSWQGDYPVAHLSQLPQGQRDGGIGYIADARTFENVWEVFKPGEAVPEIDLKSNLILFARNTQFFNRIRIGKVDVEDGVAEVLAMETMSAMPIQDKVAMSLVVVSRKGIESIRSPDGPVAISDQSAPQTYVCECSDGYRLTARTEGGRAWLFLPSQTVNLPLVSSGSDAKYSEGLIRFRAKGDKCYLEIGENRHADCMNNRTTAIWEDAKLRGVDFRARGNEPGWHLEITASQEIVFVGDYGSITYGFVTPKPLVDQQARTTTYEVHDAQHHLVVLIEGRSCQDTMSGESFDATVTVALDGKEYRGCGKALH